MQAQTITRRRVARLIAVAAIAMLVPAAAAWAAPPTVTSVTPSWNVTVNWTLPAGMKAYSVEIATSTETYADGDSKGGFYGQNWADAAILLQTPAATSWSTTNELPAGTYYLHVAAYDGSTCTSSLALGCAKEWSDIVMFTVPPRSFGVGLNLLSSRKPYFSWGSYCCPSPFDINLLEIATDPDVYEDGPFEGLFLEENLVLVKYAPFNSPASYSSERPLAGGNYYFHAVGVDRRYCPTYDPERLLCRDEVSKAKQFEVAATPPVLTSAAHTEGAIDLDWILPVGMRSDFVEIATAPDVYSSGLLRGAFREENLVLFDDSLLPRDDAYTTDPLPPGTYYLHVGAYVSGSCTTFDFPPGCFDEYSETARVEIPAPPAPAAPQTTAGADATTAFSLLRVRKLQSARRLSVMAAVDEDAMVRVTGRVRVSGSSRTFKLRAVRLDVEAGRTATLRLKLARRDLVSVLRAIARRRAVTARLTITVRDRAGNEASSRRTVRLRR
jgi:hypothetical protein